MRKQREFWRTNRQMTLRNRLAKFWCWSCDAYLVYPGQRCPRCRHQARSRVLKDYT